MRKVSVLVVALLLCDLARAQLNIPGLNQQPFNALALKDPTLGKTGLILNEDEIVSDQDLSQMKLNQSQLHESKVWGLTLDEEKRYVLLMENKGKIYYEGLRLTPLDILGINARNETERQHFAELSALQEAQKVSKNIAWNNSFYKAYNKLFANVPVLGNFDPSPFSPYAHKPVQLHSGDTLYFFLKETDGVKTILLMLMEAIEQAPDTHLHLMLLDLDDASIQIWANKYQIPQHLVNNGQISLNHGDLNYQALTIDKKTSPLLLLSKNGYSSIINLGRF